MICIQNGLPWWLRWWRIHLQCGRPGFNPWLGRSPGEGMAIHSSILAWRIPWTEEPDKLESMKTPRVGYDWATFTLLQNMFQCIHLRSPLDLVRAGVLFGIPRAWNIQETEKWLSGYLLSKWMNKWFENFLKTHRCIRLLSSFFPPYACIHLSDLIKK